MPLSGALSLRQKSPPEVGSAEFTPKLNIYQTQTQADRGMISGVGLWVYYKSRIPTGGFGRDSFYAERTIVGSGCD